MKCEYNKFLTRSGQPNWGKRQCSHLLQVQLLVYGLVNFSDNCAVIELNIIVLNDRDGLTHCHRAAIEWIISIEWEEWTHHNVQAKGDLRNSGIQAGISIGTFIYSFERNL